jgi:hypothetical protein
MKKFLYSQPVSNKVMMLADLPNSKKGKKIIRENYATNDGYEKGLIHSY